MKEKSNKNRQKERFTFRGQNWIEVLKQQILSFILECNAQQKCVVNLKPIKK